MILYHVTTPKKAKLYKEQGKIISPVRGFNTFTGALAWACKVGRTVVLEITCDESNVHKLPDHHNKFGTAYWHDGDIQYSDYECIFSADKDG